MPLADYLASKYLSADTKPSKKRKRKDAHSGGLVIADDDANEWVRRNKNNEGSDDDSPMVMGGIAPSNGFSQPAKKSTWVRIGVEAPKDSEQVTADAILARTQAELARRERDDEEAPAILDDDEERDMATPSAAVDGLQTAAQFSETLKRKERAERKAMKEAGLDPTGQAQDTIYRDASGRIINVAMKRAELRQKAEEEERKKREEIESRQGDVQRREKEVRKRELEDAKIMTVARHADDKQLNDELKSRQRWNDPMAQLLASKNANTDSKVSKGNKPSGRTYQGAFEPNRYGIRPGWRWDGVDRSNGFERKWFAARNKAKDRSELEYAWQMDE